MLIFQHMLTYREMLTPLKTPWPIRASRQICQSEEEEAFHACHATGSPMYLSRIDVSV